MKKKLLLLFLWIPFFALSQFSQTTTVTPEFCAGDGKVSVNVSGTVSGAVFDFQFFRLPNSTTPYRTVSGVVATSSTLSHTEPNLPAGNYSVITFENRAGVITQKSSSFTITNNFTAVQFTNSVTYTCGVGKITANVSAGKPSTYELRKSSDNSLVIAPQSSNVFNNIAPGTYNVIVTDMCGNKKSLSATVVAETNNYDFVRSTTDNRGFLQLVDCNHFNHNINITRNGTNVPAEKYPLTITYQVTGPGGSPVTTLNYTMNSPADNGLTVTNIPFYYNQAFTIKATVTDVCGITYSEIDNIPAKTIDVLAQKPAAVCGKSYLRVRTFYTSAPYTLEFTSYPVGFNPSNYHSGFAFGSYSGSFTDIPDLYIGSFNNPLPNGNYTIKVTDACGHTITNSFTISNDYVLRNIEQKEGCGDSGGLLVRLTASNNLQQVTAITTLKVMSGPSTFSATYPVDISSQAILANGDAIVGGLPAGTYVLEAAGGCPSSRQLTVTIKGAIYNVNNSISYNCGSFDLTSNLTSNLNYPEMYLEHYNTTNSTWEQVAQMQNTTSSNNYSGTINNIAKVGDFRIRLYYRNYVMGDLGFCTTYTNTFHVENKELSLNNYYVIACSDNTYNLIIDASGLEPLHYKIVEKDGVAVNIDNGNDPVFTNLNQGNYKVEISDNCGNVKVFSTRIVANKLPRIKTSNLCNGQNGYLYVDGLSFLTIHWYKNGINTGVTGNRYNFTPYHTATDAGLYEAVLTYEPNANSCINNTISYTLSASNENNASAGTGGTYTLNSSDVTGPINLFSYLTGTYDTYGEWTETTNSGLLIDNNWYANLASGGTYTFKYTVNGTCSGSATSIVTIIFKKACYQYPVTDNNITIPSKHGITALGRAGNTNDDNWPMTRQSGYTVLESKTKGFVVNRLNTAQIQAITDAGNAVDGMMVYDTDAQCLKIYVNDSTTSPNNGWHCFSTPACPQD